MVNIPQDEWQGIIDVYEQVGNDLLFSIIKTLSKKRVPLEEMEFAEWKLQKLKDMGLLRKESIKKISQASKKANVMLSKVIDKVALKAIKEQGIDGNITSSIYVAINAMKAQAEQTFNLVNTVMQAGCIDTMNGYFVGLTTARNEALNKGITEAVLGGDSIPNIIRKTIHDMSEKGVCTFLDKSGREWSADSYVSMDIRTTLNNTAHEAIDAQARDYGEDIILVSSHAGARSGCAKYQGLCFSMSGKNAGTTIKDANDNEYYVYDINDEQFKEDGVGYGDPAGLFGINCKHTYRYVRSGRFVNREQPLENEQQIAENKKQYALSQSQRHQERNIRIKEREYEALELAQKGSGADLKVKIRDLKNSYKNFCEKYNLRYRNDRLELLF